MHKIGDVLKLNIDSGSVLGVGGLWKAGGTPSWGLESKLGLKVVTHYVCNFEGRTVILDLPV